MRSGLLRSKLSRLSKLKRLSGHRVFQCLGIISVVAAGILATTVFVRPAIPDFENVRRAYRPSDRWIVDRDGRPMELVRSSTSFRSLEWIEVDKVSPALTKTLILAEDKRFNSHIGVDLWAIARSVWGFVKGEPRRGASTISMQVYDQLTSAKKRGGSQIWRKLRQIAGALALERRWSKNEILEAYINLVPFRGEIVGLRAASHGFFGHAPQALDENESALLVALIRAPNASPDAVALRACRMTVQGHCDQLRDLAIRSFGRSYQIARERDVLPVLSHHFVTSESASLVHTTLDSRIQELALQAVREQMRELQERNVNDAAVVVLDTRSGQILAYVGNSGRGYTEHSQIDGVTQHRQAGSSLKPFVYATAFDMRLLDMSSLIEDSPENIGVGGGSVYNPRNYDHSFQGVVSAAEALASSLNVPAVRTLSLVGEGRVLERMRALGFSELRDEDHYGPSLALGTVDVSLLDLTEAYRRLSLFSDAHVFSDFSKQQIFAALSRPEYRRFTFGLESILNLPFPAAVKTGTSKDMRDNWCVGYTSDYTVGVWVGNFDGQSMWNVSGITGAAPIWQNLMSRLHAHPPRDLNYAYVAPAAALSSPTIARIRYPQADMLIGLDPDIPRRAQKLPIEIEHPQKGQSVFVDGLKVGTAHEFTLWPLQRGHHAVELRTRIGQVVDRTTFTVR